jgi:hypothetical protein
MATKKGVHVTPHGNKWAVKREGNERASSLHDTQKQAEKEGRATARRDNTEFFLHNRQGEIRQRDSYGNDPHPPDRGRSKTQLDRDAKQPPKHAPEPRPRLPLLSGGKDPTLAERFEEELYGFSR